MHFFLNTFVKGPFRYLNDRFPYPFIYRKSAKDTPFGNKICHRYFRLECPSILNTSQSFETKSAYIENLVQVRDILLCSYTRYYPTDSATHAHP